MLLTYCFELEVSQVLNIELAICNIPESTDLTARRLARNEMAAFSYKGVAEALHQRTQYEANDISISKSLIRHQRTFSPGPSLHHSRVSPMNLTSQASFS